MDCMIYHQVEIFSTVDSGIEDLLHKNMFSDNTLVSPSTLVPNNQNL